MESDNDPRDLLRMADRAEAAPWTDYPPTPAWYPPVVGAWGAALVLAFGVLDGGLRIGAVLGLVALEGASIAWYRSVRGTLPSGPPPRELRPAAALFLLAVAGLFGVAVLSVVVGAPVAGAAVVLLLLTAVLWWYERAYAAAMAATRARLR